MKSFPLISFLFVGIISFSCQTKPKEEADKASATSIQPADTVAILSKRPGPEEPRSAADRLVRALYFEHNKEDNPFRETKDRTLIDQFFTKSTADLIWKDTQQKTRKFNCQQTNLLFKAPDKAVKKTWVMPATVAGSRAVVYITFQDNDKPVEIRAELEQIASRWRIADLVYPDGTRLTALLK